MPSTADLPDLEGFPITLRIPVQWGELDAYGHVNNAVFFRYFESARMAYLDRCGLLASFEEERVGAILHSTQCRFRRPLYHPDTVRVGARVMDLHADRFTMAYQVESTEQHATVAEGSGLVVAYDYTAGCKTNLPPAVRARIEALEAEAG